jgi:hypothetical protein
LMTAMPRCRASATARCLVLPETTMTLCSAPQDAPVANGATTRLLRQQSSWQSRGHPASGQKAHPTSAMAAARRSVALPVGRCLAFQTSTAARDTRRSPLRKQCPERPSQGRDWESIVEEHIGARAPNGKQQRASLSHACLLLAQR